MTDWSRLHHAYGPAGDIPALLDEAESGPGGETRPGRWHELSDDPRESLWQDLWSALCHQGTVYPASFAALPRLTALAVEECRRGEGRDALLLASGILAGADQPHGAGDIRDEYATQIATLRRLVEERLRAESDPYRYLHLLGALMGIESAPVWEELLDTLFDMEGELECPECGEFLRLDLDAQVFVRGGDDSEGSGGLVPDEGRYGPGPGTELTPLRPADPKALEGMGLRLHRIALRDGQRWIADCITRILGAGTCPECRAEFNVGDELPKQWGY